MKPALTGFLLVFGAGLAVVWFVNKALAKEGRATWTKGDV